MEENKDVVPMSEETQKDLMGQLEEIAEQLEDPSNKGVVLDHKQVKELGVKRNKKGVPVAHSNPGGPNRMQRRAEKQRDPHRNAKNNGSRKTQIVPVTMVVETKLGPVPIETGFTRKIVHTSTAVKEQKNRHAVINKAAEARKPKQSEQDIQKDDEVPTENPPTSGVENS